MKNHLNCVSIHLTDEETKQLEEVWRGDFSVKSRSEFIKTAINEHAKKQSAYLKEEGL